MVAGGDHGLPWRRAGRQWLRLLVATKIGGQLHSVSIFVTREHHGGKNYANFADAAAPHPTYYAAASRQILIPLSRE